MRVFVTGATGFVGTATVAALRARGHHLTAAVRRAAPDLAVDTQVVIGDLGASTVWDRHLEGMDAVVHLAGRAHVMHDGPEGAAAFRRTNVEGTLGLARAALESGVNRFVFVSSIKVNGEATDGIPFRSADEPAPRDEYGRSKAAAEQALFRLLGERTVVVRPTLVHGPAVKGNLARLCRIAAAGLPVPFGSIDNRRDMVGVVNLADLLATCVEHPSAAGQVFLASDGQALSTPAVFRAIAAGLGMPARVLPCPVGVLRSLAKPLGLGAEMDRLTGSLEVDSGPTRTLLGWHARVDIHTGLAQMARAWRESRP